MNSNSELNILIAKKSEKVVTGIYLISQFLNDTEHLKLELRNSANELLKNVNLFAYNNTQDIFSLYKNSLDSVSLLILYTTLAKNSNLISAMNCNIILSALRALESILVEEQFKFNKENISILEEDLFYNFMRKEKTNYANDLNTSYDVLTNRNLQYINSNREKDNLNYKRHLDNINDKKNINDSIKQEKRIDNSNNGKENKDFRNIIPSTKPKNIKNKKNFKHKDSRREQILNVFTRGVEVSINDISKKVIGCSIKTIQRELNILLDEKRILKIGEKRWSRYKLIS